MTDEQKALNEKAATPRSRLYCVYCLPRVNVLDDGHAEFNEYGEPVCLNCANELGFLYCGADRCWKKEKH